MNLHSTSHVMLEPDSMTLVGVIPNSLTHSHTLSCILQIYALYFIPEKDIKVTDPSGLTLSQIALSEVCASLTHSHTLSCILQIYALYFIPEKDIKVSDFGKNPAIKKISDPTNVTRDTDDKKMG